MVSFCVGVVVDERWWVMEYNTTPITVDEALKLIDSSDGEVVSASREEYFSNITSWSWQVAKAEIADDSITIIFRLHNDDFVVYCCVRSEA